jgi:hypothetical protein
MKLLVFGSLFGLVASMSNYVLIPKHTIEHQSVQDMYAVALEHGLEPLVTAPFFPVFVSDHANLLKYRNTLNALYEIEEDSIFSITAAEETIFLSDGTWNTDTWHLNRIVQREHPIESDFPFVNSGSCHRNTNVTINTYIIDTGIDITHPSFNGRAVWGSNFVDTEDTDCNNHGTHVAGLVGSSTHGVCVDANLIAVKVLDCDGAGSLTGVIRGIEWAFKDHIQKKETSNMTVKSVINMSLGGGYSKALNKAVQYCIDNDKDFNIVVAAGNENQDACDGSPASVQDVITVMASDHNDKRAWFSNWGSCANVYAPGVDIISTIPDESFAKYSGTSMASPIVAGVLNHYIDMHPNMSFQEIKNVLLKSATLDVIQNNKKSNNSLVYLAH